MPRRSLSDRFDERVQRGEDCWLWTGAISTDGYGLIRHDGRSTRAHRVAWLLMRGSIPEGLHVLHRCDVRACVRPEHLFLGTNHDNVLDREAKGRNRFSRNRGEANPGAKLDERAVLAIRSSCEPLRVIAGRHGVSTSMVSLIRLNKAWQAVSSEGSTQ